MVRESDGLIYKGLYKNGLVTASESSHNGNYVINNIFDENKYWDSSSNVLPPWLELRFSVPLFIKYYSIKMPSITRYINSWRVYDSKNVLIDLHTDETCFNEPNQFLSFSFNKVIKTESLKIFFDKGTFSSGAVYVESIDVYGSFNQSLLKYMNKFYVKTLCVSKRNNMHCIAIIILIC